ncbi:hypothetical protein Patl1_08730 [Pistacia atlantica]|uniref:Uncharacterized protein n=1 Tax=Pistacia atlantica TaxID=434234 RepID=A0ACC1AGZ6_9ROSI|nr:hypothetical protein Patl1_08730 [Pistacia atlantica]
MAEILLSPLLQVVFEKLANPFLEEIANRCGLRKEVKKLQRTLCVIQAVLQGAEERQLTDRALKLWLEELKEVAYEMEDLLDEFSPEALLPRNRGGLTQQVLTFVPSLVQYGDLLTKLEQIKGTLEMLAEERSNFNLSEGVVNSSRSRRTGSFIIESEIFGREEDKERVMEVLLSTDDKLRGEVSVISIVGLGGLGKTTLAQLAFNDEKVARHFDMKIWASVNDDFDVERIMTSVIESAIKELPETVCSLCNLQVIDLSNCFDLIKLPSRISIISKLRHLIIDGCNRLTKMPPSIGKLVFLRTLSMFIVGSEVDERLNQLQSLNLGGQLNITHLEKVRDARDAMEADLLGKRNLLSLSLSWGDDLNGSNRNVDNEDVSISLPWANFPSFKVLYLQGMDAVKNIGPEFYGEGTERAFPLLKELTFIDFPQFEYWWSSNRREEFPSLVKLNITKCFRLRNIPQLPYLQHLELHHCSDVILRSASKLTSVTILVINGFTEQLAFLGNMLQNNALLMSITISSCPKLHSIPSSLGKLINLKSLTIRWSKELTSLPDELQNLTSLESLEIIECDSLTSLPEDIQSLSSLRTLSIENCNSLTSLPHNLQFLTSLEHLTIMYCPKLTSLPEDLRHLFALKRLSILNCPEVASLPEGLKYVTTLQNLEIRGCSGLKVFPEWVANLNSLRSLTLTDCHNLTSLPGGLQCVSSLQHLSIRECPDLEERCKKDIGEDWVKINRISHVYIGSPAIASSSSH